MKAKLIVLKSVGVRIEVYGGFEQRDQLKARGYVWDGKQRMWARKIEAVPEFADYAQRAADIQEEVDWLLTAGAQVDSESEQIREAIALL